MHVKRAVYTTINGSPLWSFYIQAHVQHGDCLSALELFIKMLQERVPVDRVASLCAVKACCHLRSAGQGRLVHGVIVENSLEADKTIGNAIVGLYVKCGTLNDAQCLFNKLRTRDVVSWSSLIGGYADQGHGVIALELFQEALRAGLTPNRVTFLSALKACGSVPGFQDGMLIHNQICRAGMEANIMLASSLVDMYAKCGALEEARIVFTKVCCHKSVVPWNAIISGYLQYGDNAMALDMLQKLELQGLNPNKVTLLFILKACPSLETLVLGRLAHDKIIRMDLISDVTVGNALVDMDSKCGSVEEAERAFSMLKVHNVVSWSAIVDGFIRHGQHASALEYYMKMQEEKILPDEATFSSILGACIVGFIEQGKFIHNCIIKSKLELNSVIGSALVNMYAKSGLLLEARNVLHHLSTRSTVSWCALVAGYYYYGHASLAIESFLSMQREGVAPDEASFVCTLKACVDVGDLELGKALHHQLTISSFNADAQVGTTLVDFYGKNSCLEDARRVFDCLMTRDVVTYGALIGGYVFCKEFKMAIDCLKEMQQQGLRPPDPIFTSVISGCTYTGQVKEGHNHFQCMTGDYDVKPSIENYTCMVDLLGRSGSLRSAKDVIHTMPMLPDDTSWTSLLTSCKVYGDTAVGHGNHAATTKDNVKPPSGNIWMFGNCSSGNTKICKVRPNLDTHKVLTTREPRNPVFCQHCERLAFALGLPKPKKRKLPEISSVCSACHNFVHYVSNSERRKDSSKDSDLCYINKKTIGVDLC